MPRRGFRHGRGSEIRDGPYGAVSADGLSDGLVHFVFAPEGRDESPLTSEEVDMVRWVVDHEKSVHDGLMGALLEAYPEVREQALDWCDDDEAAELLPEVTGIAALKQLCGVVSINVHPLAKLGIPFIGVELGCTWDDEHGAGVVLHGDRALECGQADTAILLWVAKKYA